MRLSLQAQILFSTAGVFVGQAAYAQVGHPDSAIACAAGNHKVIPGAPCTILVNRPLLLATRTVTWTLDTFPTMAAARTLADSTSIIVEADNRIWRFHVGPRMEGRPHFAEVGPFEVPVANRYAIVVAFAVVPPGAHSASHTHAGPEAWYVLGGSQCVETSAGPHRATTGQGMFIPGDTPMFLTATGSERRRAFFIVVYDAARAWNTPVTWQPPGLCSGAP